MTTLHPTLSRVTDRIIEKSRAGRARYLDHIARERDAGMGRERLGCSNLAHGFAAAQEDQATIKAGARVNIGIVTAFNDMLSAHQP